jgi:ribonuclease HII
MSRPSKKETAVDRTAIESHARLLGYKRIAGIDEAGRGPLAGPVVAAACIIPEGIVIEGVNDSKQLEPAVREKLYEMLLSDKRIDYALGIVESGKIDEINILRATLEAMHTAVLSLETSPDYLLVDGLHLPTKEIPGLAIVEGDSKSQSIAAASILAKVTRDRLMLELHEMWPMYGFNKHKGYGTKEHLEAIVKYGLCPVHRMTFEPLKSLFLHRQLTFF